MALKTVLVACVLVASVSAQYGGYGRYDEYDPNPQYQFAYSVHDASTYDIKSQQESRQGDVVYGNYQLQEPDGSTRTVEYSDTGYGFQATVHKAAGAHPPVYRAAPAPYRRY